MPLYTSIDGTRKEIQELYAGRAGVRTNTRLLQAGVGGVSKNIFYSKSLMPISNILIQLESVTVYSYPNATSSSMGDQGEQLHTGNGYSAYADIDVVLQSSNNRLRVTVHPKNLKQQVHVFMYPYAQLSNGDLIALASYLYIYNQIVSQTSNITYATNTSGIYSGSADWYGWGSCSVAFNDSVYSSDWGRTDVAKPPYEIEAVAGGKRDILDMAMLRVYGNGYNRVLFGDITVNNTVVPLAYNNLLTP